MNSGHSDTNCSINKRVTNKLLSMIDRALVRTMCAAPYT